MGAVLFPSPLALLLEARRAISTWRPVVRLLPKLVASISQLALARGRPAACCLFQLAWLQLRLLAGLLRWLLAVAALVVLSQFQQALRWQMVLVAW